MNTLKHGFFLTGKEKPRYLPATLLAGPYDFHNAIKLKTADGDVITTQDRFVNEPPLTPLQLRWKEKRDEIEAKRRIDADNILGALQAGPMTLKQLHCATAQSKSALCQRITRWKELSAIKVTTEDGVKMYSL